MMFRLNQNYQIFQGIIMGIAIDVMHMLISCKLAPKMLLHNESAKSHGFSLGIVPHPIFGFFPSFTMSIEFYSKIGHVIYDGSLRTSDFFCNFMRCFGFILLFQPLLIVGQIWNGRPTGRMGLYFKAINSIQHSARRAPKHFSNLSRALGLIDRLKPSFIIQFLGSLGTRRVSTFDSITLKSKENGGFGTIENFRYAISTMFTSHLLKPFPIVKFNNMFFSHTNNLTLTAPLVKVL